MEQKHESSLIEYPLSVFFSSCNAKTLLIISYGIQNKIYQILYKVLKKFSDIVFKMSLMSNLPKP